MCIVKGADAARGLDAYGRADHAPHEGYVLGGSAAWPKAGGGLDKVCLGGLGKLAGDDFFFVAQQRRLDDDFEDGVASVAGASDRGDVALDQFIIPRFERADVDDHIYLGRAVADGLLGLEHLALGRGSAQRKADHGADQHVAALQQLGAQLDVGGVDAHRGKVVFAGLVAQLGYLVLGGVGLENGVVNHVGQAAIGGRDAQGAGDAVRPGADHGLHPLHVIVRRDGGRASAVLFWFFFL